MRQNNSPAYHIDKFLCRIPGVIHKGIKRMMGHLANLWRGNFSLPVTYWLWGALGVAIAYLPLLFIALTSGFSSNDSFSLIIVYFFICGSYHFLVPVGIWRAAARHTGSTLWIMCARLAAVLSLAIQYVWIQAFLDLGVGHAAIYVGTLIIVGVLLEFTAASDNADFLYSLENPAETIELPPSLAHSPDADAKKRPAPRDKAAGQATNAQVESVANGANGAKDATVVSPAHDVPGKETVTERVERPVRRTEEQGDVVREQIAGLWKTRSVEQRKALADELAAVLAASAPDRLTPPPSVRDKVPGPIAAPLSDFGLAPPPVLRKSAPAQIPATEAERPAWAKAFKQAYGDNKGDVDPAPGKAR